MSKSLGKAIDHFGFLAFAIAADNPTSSIQTYDLMVWLPVQPGLIADLEEGRYFSN